MFYYFPNLFSLLLLFPAISLPSLFIKETSYRLLVTSLLPQFLCHLVFFRSLLILPPLWHGHTVTQRSVGAWPLLITTPLSLFHSYYVTTPLAKCRHVSSWVWHNLFLSSYFITGCSKNYATNFLKCVTVELNKTNRDQFFR